MEAVEHIILDLYRTKEVYLNSEAFVTMKKLRLLMIYYKRNTHQFVGGSFNFGLEDLNHQIHQTHYHDGKQHMSGNFEFLSPELRLLVWHQCPLKSLLSSLHPMNLVYLDMSYSHIEQL